VGIGAMLLWRERASGKVAAALGFTLAVGAVWAFVLLDRVPEYLPWLRYLVVVLGLAATAVILIAGRVPSRVPGRVMASAGALGLTALLLGPIAYTLNTVDSAHTGAIPTAGPASAGGFPGGPGGGGRPGGGFAGANRNGTGNGTGNGFGNGNGFGAGRGAPSLLPGQVPGPILVPGQVPGQSHVGRPLPAGSSFGAQSGMGGLLISSSASAALAALLESDANQYTWAAAVTGSNNAAGYQLATDDPVMAIGGFNGTDPAPSLAQFVRYVQEGKIHYYISGSTGAQGTGSSVADQIATWVTANFTAKNVGGVTVYDLTAK
jgi:hypothetical protein